jgi:hypothetical protein
MLSVRDKGLLDQIHLLPHLFPFQRTDVVEGDSPQNGDRATGLFNEEIFISIDGIRRSGADFFILSVDDKA